MHSLLFSQLPCNRIIIFIMLQNYFYSYNPTIQIFPAILFLFLLPCRITFILTTLKYNYSYSYPAMLFLIPGILLFLLLHCNIFTTLHDYYIFYYYSYYHFMLTVVEVKETMDCATVIRQQGLQNVREKAQKRETHQKN